MSSGNVLGCFYSKLDYYDDRNRGYIELFSLASSLNVEAVLKVFFIWVLLSYFKIPISIIIPIIGKCVSIK